MLAHQGGWDEILLVLGPIAVIIGLLMLAKNRVDRRAGSPSSHAADPQANPDDVNDRDNTN